MFPDDIEAAAARLVEAARAAGLKLATAESCTAGLVSAAITAVSGSAEAFERGFVTYDNRAKHEMLGVERQLLDDCGAVSEAVARAMALGALAHSHADVAVSVTGIAGPTGGTPLKPVGLVHFAVARRGGQTAARVENFGALGRERVRLASVRVALGLLQSAVEG